MHDLPSELPSVDRRRLSPQTLHTFWRFCVVGFSGVGVNLFTLFLAQNAGMMSSLASALAIEVSICSNFFLNETWTFKGRGEEGKRAIGSRALRFQMVSLVGAVIQWSTFIIMNIGWLYLGLTESSWIEYRALLEQSSWYAPISNPPQVDGWVYLSQIIGIGVSTLWNFLINFYWTWGERSTSLHHPP